MIIEIKRQNISHSVIKGIYISAIVCYTVNEVDEMKRTSHRGDAVVENRKMRLLYLMDYLREYSDIDHPVRLKDIAAHLTAKGIYTTRKALYDDFAVLNDYGFEIIRTEHKYTYFYASPPFELPELKILTDIIYASGFISEKKTDDLVTKLGYYCSRYQRIQLNKSRQMLTVSAKSKNEQILYNVNYICEAISKDCQISFLYADYITPNGEKHYRHQGERYVRSPIHLVYSDNQYYLICYNAGERRKEHLRIDRMENIAILTGERRQAVVSVTRQAARDYGKFTFSMYAHEEKLTDVTIRFTNNLRSVVYDRFGDIMLFSDGPRHFTITTPIAVSPQFFGWVLGLGRQAVIMRPKSVREEMRAYLQGVTNLYDDAQS